MEALLQDYYTILFGAIKCATIAVLDDDYLPCAEGLHELIQPIIDADADHDYITFNFNEAGKLHSRYLEDRYEPAIIICRTGVIQHYFYLFDGKIKDCIHPLFITKSDIDSTDNICQVVYYSSERITEGLPISIFMFQNRVQMYYNLHESRIIIRGNRLGVETIDMSDYIEKDYSLHDCMEPPFIFVD